MDIYRLLEVSMRICINLWALDDDNIRLQQVRLSDSEEMSCAQNTHTWIRQCQNQRARIYKLMRKPLIDYRQILLGLAKIIEIVITRVQLMHDAADDNRRRHLSKTKVSCKDRVNDLIKMNKNFEVTQNQLMAPESSSITNNSFFLITQIRIVI